MRKLVPLLLTISLFSATTLAYGPRGHKLVGSIADKRLAAKNRAVARKVHALLDGLTLEQVATLPDNIKSWDDCRGNGNDNPVTSKHRINDELRAFWEANKCGKKPSHDIFHYTDVPVLEGLNLTIPYGQSVALVGASGSGKSTISQLILRLYDPQEGTVRIGGVDLRRCSGPAVRRLFGIVPQQPYFFRATILDNVRLLKPAAEEAEVWRALELAHAAAFVRDLPEARSNIALATTRSTRRAPRRNRWTCRISFRR